MNLDKVTPGLKNEIRPAPPLVRTECLIPFLIAPLHCLLWISVESYALVLSLASDSRIYVVSSLNQPSPLYVKMKVRQVASWQVRRWGLE